MDIGEGRRYKSRKDRPCDSCRRRKICCVREPGHQNCVLCRSQSRECRFDSVPKIRAGRLPSRRTRPAAHDGARVDRDVLLTVENGIEQTVTVLEDNDEGRGQRSSDWRTAVQFVGLSGYQDPFVLQHCSFNTSNYYRQPDWMCLRVNGGGLIPMQFTVVLDKHREAKPSYYPAANFDAAVIHHRAAILQTYFHVIHTAYPLLDPARFVDTGIQDCLLRAAICVLATPYCPKAQDVSLDECYSFIYQALPIDTRYPRLETIEAALLFIQRDTAGNSNSGTTTPGQWSDIGSLVGITHELGLNVDPSSWNIPQADRDRRIRLWWAVYIQEKWSAFGLGRATYLNEEYNTVPMITTENFSTRGYYDAGAVTQTSAQIFVAMAALTTVLSDMLKTFYTMKGMARLHKVPPIDIYNLVAQFDERLDAYKQQYLMPLHVVDMFLDPTGTVFLAFYTLEVILCRAVLRNVDRNDSEYPSFRLRAKHVVSNVVMLLERLQVNRLRAFWWSPVSRVNFAVAGSFMFSMLLTSVDDDEVEYWSHQVHHYRRLLEMQSVSFSTTKLAAWRMSHLASTGQGVDELGHEVMI